MWISRIYKIKGPSFQNEESGFTLLEVMVALSIIAIALTAVLSLQSQGLSIAGEAKFNTTASLLAQKKLSEIETMNPEDLVPDSGDFEEGFPGYTWRIDLNDVSLDSPEDISTHLKQIDLEIAWGESEQYRYLIRHYCFIGRAE